jgi:hypothetical protein
MTGSNLPPRCAAAMMMIDAQCCEGRATAVVSPECPKCGAPAILPHRHRMEPGCA